MNCLLCFEKSTNFFQNDKIRFTASVGGVVVETRRVDKCHMKAILHQEIILLDVAGLRLQAMSNIRDVLPDYGVDELA